MLKYDTGAYAKEKIAERLRASRDAIGLNQQDFGDQAGLSQAAYNQYETGRKRPSIDTALALCETYDLTLDWIFRGDPSGLPDQLFRDLKRLQYKP